MKFKFPWIRSRKILFVFCLIDFTIFYSLFFHTFNDFILKKAIFIFLLLSNSLIWLILSYVVGRYEGIFKNKINLLLNNLSKSFLTSFLSIFLLLFEFRIFWNWNYMNFDSFSIFINTTSFLYLQVFILSTLVQITINLYLNGKHSKRTFWLFLGNLNRKNQLNKIIGKKSNFKIQLYNPKYMKMLNSKIDGVIIDDEGNMPEKNISFLFQLNNKGTKFINISNWCERYLNRYPSRFIKLNDIISNQFNFNSYSIKGRLKRIGEALVSLIILVITFPILITAILMIKLEDGGPIFYTQIRNGFEGKTFKIIKLRTMIINAEKNGEQWSNLFDKRITKVGSILRKLRIDELPQIFLVLNGKMSLIGPRPERPNIDKFLRTEIPNYDLRYSIKPGITGWAQVNYPYCASLEDSRYKLSYDLYYIKNFSILLDCIILLKTIKLVLNGKGSKPIANK